MFLAGAFGAGLATMNAPFAAGQHQGGTPACLSLCLLGLTAAWALVRNRSLNALRCAWAGCVIGFASVVLYTAPTSHLRGEHWSAWNDPRPGDPYRQYPLNNREAITLASIVLTAALTLVIWAPVRGLIRRHKTRRPVDSIAPADH
jgi:hypothetical protein